METPGVTVCLAGATATGKTAAAQRLAEETGAAILSADAMLVYGGMDVGTAKPSPEERGCVPYFGLDCVSPAEPFSAAAWLEEAARARHFCAEQGRPLIVAGGTGLYFSALLRGLDPTPPGDPALRAELEQLPLDALRARAEARGITAVDAANPRRLIRALEIIERGGALPAGWGAAPKPRLLALTWERSLLHARIARRAERMFAHGLPEETARLRKAFPEWSRTAAQAIGYAEAVALLEGRLSRAEAVERTTIRTRQLARRQETYLRHQFEVQWVRGAPGDDAAALLAKLRASGACPL